MEIVLLILALLGLVVLIILFLKIAELQRNINHNLEDFADNLSDQISYQLEMASKNQLLDLSNQLNHLQTDLYQQLNEVRQVLHQNLTENRDRSDQRLEIINQNLNQSVCLVVKFI